METELTDQEYARKEIMKNCEALEAMEAEFNDATPERKEEILHWLLTTYGCFRVSVHEYMKGEEAQAEQDRAHRAARFG